MDTNHPDDACSVFFVYTPTEQKGKKRKKFLSSLKNGDLVVTKSGMHGKIIEVNDNKNTCVILTMAGKIKFDKTALSFELSSELNKKEIRI